MRQPLFTESSVNDDVLEYSGAPVTLIDLLREALEERDGIDVVISQPVPPSDLSQSDYGRTVSADRLAAELSLEEADVQEDVESENEIIDGSETVAEAHGPPVLPACQMCHGQNFLTTRVRMETLDEDDFPDDTTVDCKVCSDCGFVHFFMSKDWLDAQDDLSDTP